MRKKKSPILLQLAFFTLILLQLNFYSFAQTSRYLNASNCHCSLLVNNVFNSFTWNGHCTNDYCDGYGTVDYYDASGNYTARYTGNISQGMRNGYGAIYNADGNLSGRGNFYQNKFVLGLALSATQKLLGDFIIDSLFDGGINRSCTLQKALFSENDDLQEVRYDLAFDGNIVNTNHYYCTLVVTPDPPYIDFVNYNDLTATYIALKTIYWGVEIYNKISDAMNNGSR